MSRDYTRWNRAGLDRFRYLDGNAALFLEDLRLELQARYTAVDDDRGNNAQWWRDLWRLLREDPESLNLDPGRLQQYQQELKWLALWETVPEQGESGQERLERILGRYRGHSKDWAWEIMRAMARAAHVLGENINAAANEGFLRTATQPENLQRLVESIDYRSKPPASAYTDMALIAKPGLPPEEIKAGLAFQHSPVDGSAPVIFETLENIVVDARLNQVPIHQAHFNPLPLYNPPASVEAMDPGQWPAHYLLEVTGQEQLILDQFAAANGWDRFLLEHFDEPLDSLVDITFLRRRALKNMADLVRSLEIDQLLFAEILTEKLYSIVDQSAESLVRTYQLSQAATEPLQQLQRDLRASLNNFALRHLRLGNIPRGRAQSGPPLPWRFPDDYEFAKGNPALIFSAPNTRPLPARLAFVDDERRRIALKSDDDQYLRFSRGAARLAVESPDPLIPKLNGPDVYLFQEDPKLDVGVVVTWFADGQYHFTTLSEVEGNHVRFQGNQPPIGRRLFPTVQVLPLNGEIRLPTRFHVAADQNLRVLTANQFQTRNEGYILVTDQSVTAVHLLEQQQAGLPHLRQKGYGRLHFDARPAEVKAGDWLIAESTEGLTTIQVDRIAEEEDGYELKIGSDSEDKHPLAERLIRDLVGFEGELVVALFNAGIRTLQDMVDRRQRPAGIPQDIFTHVQNRALTILGTLLPRDTYGDVAHLTLNQVLHTRDDLMEARLNLEPQALKRLRARLELVITAYQGDIGNHLTLGHFIPRPRGFENGVLMIHGPFKHRLTAPDYDQNPTPLFGTGIPLAASEALASPRLTAGRKVMIDNGSGSVVTAHVKAIQGQTLILDQEIDGNLGFTIGNTTLYANVVHAGHGESRAETVLGSGDAGRDDMRFVLQAEEPAFIPDPTMSRGIRADLQVKVDGRIWSQIENLADLGPEDHGYEVRNTRDYKLEIRFGDGRNGRRLPTGINNVRARYRQGNGPTGNLPARSLNELKNPHHLVQTVIQPRAAVGGAAAESAASIRRNAPADLRAMGRAVAVEDFAHLAARMGGIAQARAWIPRRQQGRDQIVEVVVVPESGQADPIFLQQIARTLSAQAPPGTRVDIRAFRSVIPRLQVFIRVDYTAFDPDRTVERVRQTLVDTFSLRKRPLGEDLYVSSIYHAVENVLGVSDSRIVLQGDPELRRLRAERDQVAYLNPRIAGLLIEVEEYQL